MRRTRGKRILAVTCATAMAAGIAGCEAHAARRHFINSVQAAQGSVAAERNLAIAFDLEVQDGLEPPAHGHFICAVQGRGVCATYDNGVHVVWNGQQGWVSPDTPHPPAALCNARRYAWLLTAPLRLRDPGVRVEALGTLPYEDHPWPCARLTFPDVEPAPPSPGLILYRDPQSHLVAVVAFVVDESTDSDGHPQWAPRSVTFDDFVEVNGLTLPTNWTFWPWTRTLGPCGDLVGVAKLSNLSLVEIEEDTFALPAANVSPDESR